jgi:hypothetical protein
LDWLEAPKLNNKGQFSIIAALLVAVVLVASVTVTYSAIRYSPIQDQPQILSAIDETNLALKQILGFTVGYYGSVLQVTGNSSYAQTLATNYLDSGLENIADIRPEWGASFNVTALSLGTNWFTNASYSQANLNVTYDLTGLGICGIAYSASCRLDVQINPSSLNNQVSLTVVKDENTPVVGLSMSSFKFYLYEYNNLSWAMANPPDEPASSSNGTYIIDIPSGINPQGFAIQVQDTRGITVAASSFSHYTGSLTFNTTTVSGGDYVNQYNSTIDNVPDQGTHSNFPAQQQGPDGVLDTLNTSCTGSQPQNYYPTGFSLLGSTMNVSGTFPTDLQSINGAYVTFEGYPTAYTSGQYATIGNDSSSGATLSSSSSSIQWQHTTGIGNNRILIVSLDVYNNGGTPTTVTGVTYGGTALTQANTTLCSTTPQVRSYIYYLVNPPIGTKTVTANFAASTLAVGGSITYTNVNQTNPMQTTVANGAGSTQSVSITASGSYNKVLYGTLGTYRTNSYSITDGQTTMWTQTGSNQKGIGSEKTVTNGSVTLSWTTPSKTVSWAAIAVLLQPTQRPSQYTCQVEFSGTSNTNSWQSLLWSIDCLANITGVNFTTQVYNWQTGYPTSGDGDNSTLIGTTSQIIQQNIANNPAAFRDVLGAWKLEFTATALTSSPFTVSIDLAQYQPASKTYSLALEEQWNDVNATYLNPHPILCIDVGASAPAGLAVDAWNGVTWQQLSNSLVSGWNNLSISSYLTSPNFTIRFRAGNSIVQKGWQIDASLLRPESDQDLFLSLQNPAATVAVELLQNGTMIWLGQNLQNTTQTVPVPPVPVKAIHVNETIDGVNQQVPFQIEDWASSYTVPLGLTSNTTVFGNRQMIVFLVNTHVSDFTVWWNGSDQAAQTPLAYTNTYFTSDNPSGNLLSNGKLSLQFSGGFIVTSTVVGTSTSSTASFMRINNQDSTYGAGIDYVIYNGVVRDIVQQEAEWSNGVTNCPNLYADMVLTLPANATYYTYQLSLMFINSTQTRTITDLCPINMTSNVGQLQTENGTLNGDPVVASGTQTFSNSTGTWAHHWSQFTDGTKGAGIMFTDQANQMLYAFDAMSPTTARGALVANSATQTISLLPVTLSSVSFQNAFDVTWSGAVATFDASAPPIYSGYGQPGLWILAELPPTITIDIEN